MSAIAQTAGGAGLKFLYHYQKFNPAHLTTLLRHHKIYCSDTSSMNDPWDFRPQFSGAAMIIDPGNMNRMLELFRQTAPPDALRSPSYPVFEETIKRDEKALQDFLNANAAVLSKELWRRRIYCLTPLPDSIRMWSHYSRNHKGLCLEFNVDNPLFRSALQVRYCKEYPTWTPQDTFLNATSVILAKSDVWGYEQEYRIIATPNYPGAPLHLDNEHCLPLPPNALSSIIIGCEADNDSVTKTIRKLDSHLPIRHARRIANQFKLEIV